MVRSIRRFLAGVVAMGAVAVLGQTTPTVTMPPASMDGLYTIRADGKAMLHGWDDRTSVPEPRVLSVVPFDVLGGSNVRGTGFWIESEPIISQPIDLPKESSSFRFFVQARIAHHELPRLRLTLKDAESAVDPVVIYDGMVQSVGRWRVVAPIPETFRGKFGILEMRLLNPSPVENKRTIFVEPAQIIGGTSQKSGSGLMDARRP